MHDEQDLARYLLRSESVDINVPDSNGEPAIFRMLVSGDWSPLAILLKRSDADPNVCDRHGMSPLEVAATRGNLAAVKLLLSTGRCEQKFIEAAAKIATTRHYNQTLEAIKSYRGTDNETE